MFCDINQWKELSLTEFAFWISVIYLHGGISFQMIKTENGYQLQGYMSNKRFPLKLDEKSRVLKESEVSQVTYFTNVIPSLMNQWKTEGKLDLEKLATHISNQDLEHQPAAKVEDNNIELHKELNPFSFWKQVKTPVIIAGVALGVVAGIAAYQTLKKSV
jgi:hypothetical protein